MAKVALGPQMLAYPMPVVLLGVKVDGRPNFMAVGWFSNASTQPPMLSVGIRNDRYTRKGIIENQTFSINLPSAEMFREVDYCGTISGSRANKVEVCKFKIFYGKSGNAPLIEQCPVNLECKVLHILELGMHSLVVGSIEETHVAESCITEGRLDLSKVNPFIYVTSPHRQYHALGAVLARAHISYKQLEAGK